MEGTSAKTLTIAAIIGSVIIWVLWLGIGSSAAAPTPTMQLSVVEHSPISLSASELGAEESSTEQTLPKRMKADPVGHLSDDFSDTALVPLCQDSCRLEYGARNEDRAPLRAAAVR